MKQFVYSGREDTGFDAGSDAPTEVGKYTVSLDFDDLQNGPAFADCGIMPPSEDPNPKTDMGGRTFIALILLLVSLAAVYLMNRHGLRWLFGLE
ncbi:MAG: hypothetical protein J5822_09240 [Eubacteriaceae bacterium]|nr:hypothetical protein [Eubacteriaceae bacterium]